MKACQLIACSRQSDVHTDAEVEAWLYVGKDENDDGDKEEEDHVDCTPARQFKHHLGAVEN